MRRIPQRVLALIVLLLAVSACDRTPSGPSASPPQLTSLAPAFGAPGAMVTVTITGANFTAAATPVIAVSGTGITVADVTVQSATTMTARLSIAADAALGARTVTLALSASTNGSAATFTVAATAPQLTAAIPATIVAGTSTTVTLHGAHFIGGATTVVVNGGGVTVGDVAVIDAATMTARLTVDAAADIGGREIRIETAGGDAGASVLTIAPPVPQVAGLSTTTLRAGSTTDVTISGNGFVSGQTTVMVSGDGVTVISVAAGGARAAGDVSRAFVAGTGTSLIVRLAIAAGAAPGPRTLTISTPGGTSTSFTFTIVPPLPEIGAFDARPATINPGGTATLSWRGISGATRCSINNNIGDVPCSDGTLVVSPGESTEYMLSAFSAGGREWLYVTIRVEPPAPVVARSASFAAVGTSTFTVPDGVTQITVDLYGAEGGPSTGVAGKGGRVLATVAVTPGESLTIRVGGTGLPTNGDTPPTRPGGANGGGNSGPGTLPGGGGGGASSVYRGGTPLVIAGGGGGAGSGSVGSTNSGTPGPGGAGGGLIGAAGGAGSGFATGGGGGTQVAGGAGGVGDNVGGSGTAGAGGTGAGIASTGGGGGGGYFGGGGGAGEYACCNPIRVESGSGGGGGSSYAISGALNVTHQQGVRAGDGSVLITW